MMERQVALFIDAENIPAKTSMTIVKEAERQGILATRRVYGDFSKPSLSPWLEAAPRSALTCIQTIGGSAGKNGADIALVIDAMDFLYSGDAEIFCIATSDSDFTQLAMRLRQAGKTVVGVGGPIVSLNFKSACDIFKTVEPKSGQPDSAGAATQPVPITKKTGAPGKTPVQKRLRSDLLTRVFIDAPPLDGGWVRLQDLMKGLQAHQPAFDVKAYGHSQFHKLLAFSGVELTAGNQKARLGTPLLKKVVDNG